MNLKRSVLGYVCDLTTDTPSLVFMQIKSKFFFTSNQNQIHQIVCSKWSPRRISNKSNEINWIFIDFFLTFFIESLLFSNNFLGNQYIIVLAINFHKFTSLLLFRCIEVRVRLHLLKIVMFFHSLSFHNKRHNNSFNSINQLSKINFLILHGAKFISKTKKNIQTKNKIKIKPKHTFRPFPINKKKSIF